MTLDLSHLGVRCEAFVRDGMDGDAAHDLAHVRRVVRWAERIGTAEGADLRVVVPAAWLHDCVTVAKDHPDRARASRLAADAAGAWLLRQDDVPAVLVPAIEHAIEAHSFSGGVEPQTLEARVVQDADRLDALGAIGLARLFATAGAMGSALMHPDDPVPTEPPGRPLDDRRYAVDHVFVKLLRIAETLRTDTAHAEAERRVARMRQFLRWLSDEVR